jgi:tyrosine-protein phosphatase non-receptor type 12/18/22
MVIECEVQVIVMACNEQEAGKYKCENYWNEDESEEKQFGKFFVKLLKSREICPDFLVRTMRLRWTADGGKGEEERTVCQFHYSAWPDHGVPTQVKPLLEMVRLIRDCQASETLPVLVKTILNYKEIFNIRVMCNLVIETLFVSCYGYIRLNT